MDDVQYIKRGWHHRDKIKTQHGIQWLTIPARNKARYKQLINEVIIDDNSNWWKKHLNTIKASYSKAPSYKYLSLKLEKIYKKGHTRMIDLNMDMLKLMASIFNITTPVVFSSSYGITSTSNERLIDLVREVGGDTYLTGTGSRAYLDEKLFSNRRINVVWQEFKHPTYNQFYGDFKQGLSAIDFLMMQDIENEQIKIPPFLFKIKDEIKEL